MQNDIDNFLNLPDWKKIQLKITQSKFNNYPIQTKEQESKRKETILIICAYFSMQSFESFINSIAQTVFDGIWPTAFELFVTPKLIDIIPSEILLSFSSCYCCEHYHGYNKTYYNRIKQSKIIPLFGNCKLAQNEGFSRSLSRVIPDQRCISWNPLRLYEQIIDNRIKIFLSEKKYSYSYEEYQKDLNTIDIWKYFQNDYKIRS